MELDSVRNRYFESAIFLLQFGWPSRANRSADSAELSRDVSWILGWKFLTIGPINRGGRKRSFAEPFLCWVHPWTPGGSAFNRNDLGSVRHTLCFKKGRVLILKSI